MIGFSLVFFKIVAILLNVVVGYIAGRFAKVERDSIASLLFYFISPIVFFCIPASANLSVSAIGITFVTFTISSLLLNKPSLEMIKLIIIIASFKIDFIAL